MTFTLIFFLHVALMFCKITVSVIVSVILYPNDWEIITLIFLAFAGATLLLPLEPIQICSEHQPEQNFLCIRQGNPKYFDNKKVP